MSESPTIQVTLLVDGGRYYVTAEIGPDSYELGTYALPSEAGARMSSFVADRGYKWANDSARRLDEAQRNDARVLILNAVPASTPEP